MVNPTGVGISITNLAERHLRPPYTRPPWNAWALPDINHESSRKAFETRAGSERRPQGPSGISITNLAERHLRQDGSRRLPSLCTTISITNLAERHLRHEAPEVACGDLEVTNINHESSRKAFETEGDKVISGEKRRISITNLAERHLRRSDRPSCGPPSGGISITNLAERHLRQTHALS